MTIHSRMTHVSPPPLPAEHSRARRKPPSQNTTALKERFAHYLTRPILRFGPFAYAACIAGVLFWAWWQRAEGHLTAESGLGYWLGIAGAVLMLVLVAYPLRKRLRSFQRFGRVANWFRFHMIIGILGPALVVLHTNFKIGSLNSRLALLTMLIVVTSGIVGRYLYAKVHRGLYGQQLALRDIHADIVTLKEQLHFGPMETGVIQAELQKFTGAGNAHVSLLSRTAALVLSGVRTRAARRTILRELDQQLAANPAFSRLTRQQRRQHKKAARDHLRLFFAAVKKAERFALFEGLLGMWHHLHMPLFIMLFLTVVMHIVAVHLY